MKSLVHTEEIYSRSVPLKHAPGAKSLVCIGLKASYKNYHNTGPQDNGHKNQGFHTQGGQKINDDTVHGGEITHIYIKHLTVFFWVNTRLICGLLSLCLHKLHKNRNN